jgi:hypothetical protein
MDDKKGEKTPAESFGELIKEFGDAVGKIFEDPELKRKAKDFADSAVESSKHLFGRFKDQEVKEKFRDVGKAARVFGNSVSDYFRDEKEDEKKDDGEDEDSEDDITKKKIKDKAAGFSSKADEAVSDLGKKLDNAGRNVKSYFKETRCGRITGYIFSIFFSTIFLIFLNYYNHYIAFYSKVNGTWMRYPFLTGDFERWLPVATAALIAGIVANIILIIYDGYLFRQIIFILIDMFSLASLIFLLITFPFDFSVIPGNDLSGILVPIVTIALIIIIVAVSIGILARFIKLIIGLVKSS